MLLLLLSQMIFGFVTFFFPEKLISDDQFKMLKKFFMPSEDHCIEIVKYLLLFFFKAPPRKSGIIMT